MKRTMIGLVAGVAACGLVLLAYEAGFRAGRARQATTLTEQLESGEARRVIEGDKERQMERELDLAEQLEQQQAGTMTIMEMLEVAIEYNESGPKDSRYSYSPGEMEDIKREYYARMRAQSMGMSYWRYLKFSVEHPRGTPEEVDAMKQELADRAAAARAGTTYRIYLEVYKKSKKANEQ